MPHGRLYLTLLGFLVASCYSTTLVQEPNNLPAGRTRLALAFNWDTERVPANPPISLLPLLALGWRVGMNDDLELRLKATFVGGEAGVNARLLDGERLRIHIMPHIAYYAAAIDDDDDYLDENHKGVSHQIQAVVVPLIFALPISTGTEFFIGPDQHIGLRDQQPFYAAGFNAGIVHHSSPSMSEMLECSFLYGLMGPPSNSGDALNYYSHYQQLLTVGDANLQCGVSLSWGGALRRGPND